MTYPPRAEKLLRVIRGLPGIIAAEADFIPLAGMTVGDLGDSGSPYFPFAAVARTDGGKKDELLGQVILTPVCSPQALWSLEFLSWAVHRCSENDSDIQIRTVASAPVMGEEIRLGWSLRAVIEFFVECPGGKTENLLREMGEFADELEFHLKDCGLKWRDGKVERA